MAVTVDTSVDGGLSVGSTLSFNITLSGNNRLLVVGVFNAGNNHALGNATLDNVNMSVLGFQNFAAANFVLGYFYVTNPNAGSHTIAVTCPEISVRALAVSLNGAAFIDGFQGSTTTTTSQSVTVTSATNNLVVDFSYNSNSNEAPDASQTLILNNEPFMSSKKAGSASVTMTWNYAGGGNSNLIAANIIARPSTVSSTDAFLIAGN